MAEEKVIPQREWERYVEARDKVNGECGQARLTTEEWVRALGVFTALNEEWNSDGELEWRYAESIKRWEEQQPRSTA